MEPARSRDSRRFQRTYSLRRWLVGTRSGHQSPHPHCRPTLLLRYRCCGQHDGFALHWVGFLEASERDSARFVDAVKMENGRPTIDAPRVRSPFEQLSPEFIRIHQAGIIRALASALDCLAGVIIGVAALPMN